MTLLPLLALAAVLWAGLYAVARAWSGPAAPTSSSTTPEEGTHV